jgi:Fur family ferric uptake transcriptional regulator
MMTAQQDSPRSGTSMRATRQGDAVVAALAETDSFSSAQDLHMRMRQAGTPVGLATIYRHLQVLVDRGQVDQVRTEDGQTLYRACETERHHHHLVCRNCGRTVEVVASGVERWTEKIAAAEGFTDIDHTLEIYGLCAACAKEAPPQVLTPRGKRRSGAVPGGSSPR